MLNKKSKTLNEEIIKSNIESNYQVQLTDYIYLQKKVSALTNLLIHKPKLSNLDYTKLNKFYHLSKSIIIPKKNNEDNDIDLILPKSPKKNKINDDNNKILYLSNPILKKIFLSNEEDIFGKNPMNNESGKKSSKYGSAFIRYNNNIKDKNRRIYSNTNYINFRPKNDLYKLPKKIKNQYKYNLTDIKNNSIKRKFQIKETISQFEKYSKYFLRGLSLSEEQNMLYQRCKKIDISLNEEQKNRKKYGNLNSFGYERKNIKFYTKTVRDEFKKKNIKEKNIINIKQNHHRYLFKYSLKNVLNTENPIKIL